MMFCGKNIFFEEADDRKNKNNGTEQTQQKNTDPYAMGEQLIKQKILWHNEKHKD